MTTDSPSGAGAALTDHIAGERVHLAGSPAFHDRVRLWNGAVTRRPKVVVQPTSDNEVQVLVRYARENSMPVSVRGGGHDWAGRSLAHDGLAIDMALMRLVTVDPASRVANVAGGATAADVVAAAEPHGLTAATGTVGDVGFVGLTLGGGYGPLNGVAGLALDNVLAAQLVLADGRSVTVDAHREPDLFWALRGGGGNFGVVTAMRVRLHPVASVTSGVILFPWHQAADVMRGYGALVPTMPDELTVQIGVISGPDGQPVVYLAPTWSGSLDAAPDWIAKLKALGKPVVVQVVDMPHSALLHLLDPYSEWGRHCEMRTRTLRNFSAAAIDALVRAGQTRTSAFSAIAIHHFHGAATRLPVEQTAFGIRVPHFVVEILAAWDPGEDGGVHRHWAQTLYADLGAHAIAGGYPSLIGPDQAAQADAAYGPNASRLLDAKRRWDPEDVFSATPLPIGSA